MPWSAGRWTDAILRGGSGSGAAWLAGTGGAWRPGVSVSGGGGRGAGGGRGGVAAGGRGPVPAVPGAGGGEHRGGWPGRCADADRPRGAGAGVGSGRRGPRRGDGSSAGP